MNILLVNLSKMVGHTGGVQKVACNFANEMEKRGHQVSLVYSDVRTGSFYYPLAPGIPCYDLCHYEGNTIVFPWHWKLRRELYRIFNKQKARRINASFESSFLLDNLRDVLRKVSPDIIVSFQTIESKLLLSDLKTTIPVVTMNHGDPSNCAKTCTKDELYALEKSAAVQVLVPSFALPIKKCLPHAKTIVIGNAIPQYETPADLSKSKSVHKIIFVGRLAKGHKRPHLLIEAFAGLAKDFPNWIVELWGDIDGKAYYKELQLLIRKNGLEKQVFLKGTTNQVKEVLQQGDIFAFPSAYEGFGLAMGEGMSMGLPAIGYKNCSAVNELIKDGINGYLCDDGIEDFRKKLSILMMDTKLRVQMGQQARLSMSAYSPEKVWNQWEDLLKDITNSQ